MLYRTLVLAASLGWVACSTTDHDQSAREDRRAELAPVPISNDAGVIILQDAIALPLDGGIHPADGGVHPPADGGIIIGDAGVPPTCAGQGTVVSPKPGVTAAVCLTTTAADDVVSRYTVTASFQINGSLYGDPGAITGTLALHGFLTDDDNGVGTITINDETSGSWTRNGGAMSASEFSLLWSQVAPGQTAPSPGGTIAINASVSIAAAPPLSGFARIAADPCQADANTLDGAADNYNLAVGGSILGAAAIGVLEVPTWGAATAGFVGLGGLIAAAKVSYDTACKNFRLCCKNNNWPAGVCTPKNAKRRGCKNS